MGFLIGFPLFIVAPCAIAAWLGTRVRSPVIAFFVAWVMTPHVTYVITVLGTPVLRAISSAGSAEVPRVWLPRCRCCSWFR